MTPILEASNLTKKYGDFIAVDHVSFTIEQGEVFGLLGPNGAGKSTTIAMLSCLYPPSDGSVTIQGYDVVKQADQVKRIIGVVPQDLALYPTLSARDNLRFFGEMYNLGGKDLKVRIETVLDIVAMRERANEPVKNYSGGMKRRINLAAGLIHGPKVLFLDEPTVGIDPQSRNHIFESVERLNRTEGMAILYTTHYMEETERLCNRIAIMDQGKIIALDTPKNLIGLLGGGIIQIGLAKADAALCAAVQALDAVKAASFLPAPEQESSQIKHILKIEAEKTNDAMIQTLHLFNQKDVEILTIETLEPNLESVFLHLTGKSLRD